MSTQPVHTWQDIPGWFQWRDAQREAVAHFGDGSRFVEVGCFLGRSVCSLAELVVQAQRSIEVVGVDTCRGSGPEGREPVDAHGPAVRDGDGTFAGTLHRNIVSCGFADVVRLLICDSVSAAALFSDESLQWVHIDASHDYDSVRADIAAWSSKVCSGGWMSGDDFDEGWWPGVVGAVNDSLPDARRWSTNQWRWLKP
jgi:Methyltransferase domain